MVGMMALILGHGSVMKEEGGGGRMGKSGVRGGGGRMRKEFDGGACDAVWKDDVLRSVVNVINICFYSIRSLA